MILTIFVILVFIGIFIILFINLRTYQKSYKTNKYKLYEFLNSIFENNNYNKNDEFYKYSIKNKLIYKEGKKMYLSYNGLSYIKEFNINKNALFYTILALIVSIISLLMNLQQYIFHK